MLRHTLGKPRSYAPVADATIKVLDQDKLELVEGIKLRSALQQLIPVCDVLATPETDCSAAES